MCRALGIVAFVVVVGLPGIAFSQCLAPRMTMTPYSGLQPLEMVPARERSGAAGSWAFANYDPDGWPVITYSPAYFNMPPLIQRFTQAHECAHLTLPTDNEFKANCAALRALQSQGAGANELKFIADYYLSLGPLPRQYGGSGARFWQGTLAACESMRSPMTKG